MADEIQNLINLYKVDNSKATTDMMAKALEVADNVFKGISKQIHNLDEHNGGHYLLGYVESKIDSGLEKIQAITEGKGDE